MDLWPYPLDGGMVRVLFSPMHMSSKPSSQLLSHVSLNFVLQLRLSTPVVAIWKYGPLDDLAASKLELERSSTVVACRKKKKRTD